MDAVERITQVYSPTIPLLAPLDSLVGTTHTRDISSDVPTAKLLGWPGRELSGNCVTCSG